MENQKNRSLPLSRSRTFKLKLSPFGAGQFLECHIRLARLTSRFLPYGATLLVGIHLLQEAGAQAVSDELSLPETARIIGGLEYFVGAPGSMHQICGELIARLDGQADRDGRITMTMIYAAAIAVMMTAEDVSLVRIYNSLR